jgi:hypothetical protein
MQRCLPQCALHRICFNILAAGAGVVGMREVDAAEVWLLLAVAIIAVLFFVGLLMPGGVTAP